ncbi:hypothetical protein N8Z24_00320 [bacterium]|nr:hypothetical protein [bacterium]
MLTPRDIVTLHNSLKSKEASDLDLTFTAAILFEKNERRLSAYVSEVQNIQKKCTKAPDAIKEMDDRKIEEAAPYLVKDEKGKPIINPDGSIQLLDDQESREKFIEIIQKYNKEYESDIKKYNDKIKEWNVFFNESEADVKIDKVPIDDVSFPKDKKFNRGKLSGLFLMLDIEDKDDSSEEDPKDKEEESKDKE